VIAEAKAAPGKWVRVNAYPSRYEAKSIASLIRSGRGPAYDDAYGPAGAFDARIEDREFDTEVHARYMVEEVA
jgi:hypothetical protein